MCSERGVPKEEELKKILHIPPSGFSGNTRALTERAKKNNEYTVRIYPLRLSDPKFTYYYFNLAENT
jgi:hypothetical protein